MSHFRFCPKHKKPLPCVHCVLIAGEMKSVQEKSTVLMPEPADKRRPGRRPKGEKAMTPGERKAAQRAREQAESEAPERSKLWRAIEKRVRNSENADTRNKEVCNIEGCDDRSHKHVKNVVENLPAMREDFMKSPIEEARQIAETYELTWDSTGRSSGEGLTGERRKKETDGARLEKVHAKAEWMERYGGGKRNQGAGPANYDKPDQTVDSADLETNGRVFNRISSDVLWYRQKLEQDFIQASDELLEGEETERDPEYDPDGLEPIKSVKCGVCDQTFATHSEGMSHIADEYDQELKQLERYQLLSEAAAKDSVYGGLLADAEAWFKSHRHAWFLQNLMRDIHEPIS
jgi:hypothetical protein